MRDRLSGGGWQAISYCLRKARQVGGWLPLYRAMRSKNTCKTCALGMGGQKGGMVNESGSFPEVCKKSVQAMASDMQAGIPESFWAQHSIDDLRQLSPRELETAGRLVQPVLLQTGERHYQPISWHDAYAHIGNHLKQIDPKKSFWYFSGRSSNEAGFLLQLFARLYGSNHINNCSYYCHQASGVGLTSVIGTGTATVVWEDLQKADLVFVIGGNPASNHPRLMTALADVRRRGGQVVVINPVRESGLERFKIPSRLSSLVWGSQIASEYLQVDIGGDLALLWGIAKRVDELGATDRPFLDACCEHVDLWRATLREMDWASICDKSGVDREEIDRVAEIYANSNHAIFTWTMGITHHAHGVSNVQAIANLALQRGMVGKPGAGLLPIRGHSNVQGIGSVGVTPKLKPAMLNRLQEKLGIPLPEHSGFDTLACIEAAADGQLDFGMCLGGNLYGSNPDAEFAYQALRRLPLIVYLNTTLNSGHAWGMGTQTLILPVLARDEEPYQTTQESMFSFVRLSDGGAARHRGPQGEIHVIARIAKEVLGDSTPVDWSQLRDTTELRKWVADVVPGFAALAEIDNSGAEFQIQGRTFHTPKFGTPSGKAVMHVHTLPQLKGNPGQWRLMTVRSEGQFNTVVYEEEDLYRGQTRRDVVLIHPDDIERFGLPSGKRVRVANEIGELEVLLQPFARIKPGNALMYFPESNVLIPRVSDPASRTPAFKGAVVNIMPLPAGVPA